MNSFFVNGKFRRLWRVLVLLSCGLFFSVGLASAECPVTFSWYPNTESNIKEYKIYYGQTNGGPYSNVVEVGNPALVNERINGTVSGLTCEQQYYFVCVAVNDANIESNYSVQVALIPSGSGGIIIEMVPDVEIIK